MDRFIDLADILSSSKLRLLAEWFDYYDSQQKNNNDEVQQELRDWAEAVEDMRKLC